jgi:type I restriction enzyme S subunit
MSFPRYPKYKDSGVEWLGAVPEHWAVSRLGFESWVRARLGWKGLKAEEYVDDGYVFLSTPNIKGVEIDFDNVNYIDQHRFDESPEIQLKEGDVLLAKDGSTLGTVNVVRRLPRPATVNSSIAVITPGQRVDGIYMHYLFESAYMDNTIQRIKGGMGVPHLFQEDLNKFYVPLPRLNEQAAIATFLDRETAKIDALVAEQQRLIKLLQEKRQAVISHAVTKGLNPDAPMKDSGIEWLGEVPEHWEAGPLKRFGTSLDGRRIPLSTEQRSHHQGDYPYYGASGVIDSVDNYLFDEDLVLVSEDGANLLNRSSPIAFVATGRYWVNNHAHIFRPIDGNLIYWAERIEAVDLTPFVSGSAQPKFTAEALLNLRIAVPPSEAERGLIQDHFVRETKAVTDLIAQAEQAVMLLQERRSALISAAVTGQIDVRGLAGSEAA